MDETPYKNFWSGDHKKKKYLRNRQLGIDQSSRPLKERNFSPKQILELFQKRIKEKDRLGKPGDKTI